MAKIRNSNIELLRIISMLMILTSHYCIHGATAIEAGNYSFDQIFLHSGILGNLGVVIFFMISGYFLGNSDTPFKFSKAIRLIFQVWIYSVICFVFAICFLKVEYGTSDIIGNVFPTMFYAYGFFSVYIFIYFLSPFLNKIIKNISNSQYFKLIIILVIFNSFLPTFFSVSYLGSYVADGIVCYLIGARINQFKLPKFKAINVILLCLGWVALGVFNSFISVKTGFYMFSLYQRISIPVLFIGMTLLYWFININIKQNRIINFAAKHAFGVFLLSDNNFARTPLWHSVFNNSYYHGGFLVLHWIISILIVYIVCALVDCVVLAFENGVIKMLKFVDLKTKVFSKIYNRKVIQKIAAIINSN